MFTNKSGGLRGSGTFHLWSKVMASSYNKTVLIGRVGQKPQRNDNGVVEFTLCNNTIGIDGKEKVMWHSIVSKNRQGELCEQYLDKGDLCCIEGRIGSKERPDGKSVQVIICETLAFLTPKHK